MNFPSCSWCTWTKQWDWGNLRFYLFVSGVNQVVIRWNEKGRWVRLPPLVTEHSAWLWLWLWLWVLSDWILWIANFRFPFYEICVQNQWGRDIKLWDPVEDSDTGDPSLAIVRMEYLFACQFLYFELCVENQSW